MLNTSASVKQAFSPKFKIKFLKVFKFVKMVEKFCCFRLESVAKCLGWLGVIQFAILIIPLIISLAFVNEFVNYLARKGGYTLFNHSDIERGEY